MAEGASVFSVQWTDLPDKTAGALSVEELLCRYLGYIKKSTLTLILGSHSPSPVRIWLYRVTQAAIHRLVTVRFLSLLYHELAGPSAAVQVVNVAVRTGRPV
jgi:hypothetical protein